MDSYNVGVIVLLMFISRFIGLMEYSQGAIAFAPIFDKMKLSRAKLAYIVDSTASPMAILVPFAGWGCICNVVN